MPCFPSDLAIINAYAEGKDHERKQTAGSGHRSRKNCERCPYPALKALAGRVELTAICSRRAENAKAMAKTHGFSHWYTDCEKMFREQRIDLACICTPNQSHGPLSKLALECGAHVICEKPLSICAAEAEALYQCANDHHRSLVACQNMRYDPSIVLARNLVERGELGDIYYATFTYLRRRGIPDWGGFHRKADNGGGCMCDLGVHQLDALLWILGNPVLNRSPVSQPRTLAIGSLHRKMTINLVPGWEGAPSIPSVEMDVENSLLEVSY